MKRYFFADLCIFMFTQFNFLLQLKDKILEVHITFKDKTTFFRTSYVSNTVRKICCKESSIEEDKLSFPNYFRCWIIYMYKCIPLHWPTRKLNCTRKENVIFAFVGKSHNVQIFARVFKYSNLCCFSSSNHSERYSKINVCFIHAVSMQSNFFDF